MATEMRQARQAGSSLSFPLGFHENVGWWAWKPLMVPEKSTHIQRQRPVSHEESGYRSGYRAYKLKLDYSNIKCLGAE
jgi:hypothetical protein